MVDPRREAVLVRPKGPANAYEDKTREVVAYRREPKGMRVTYKGGKAYTYSFSRVAIVPLERAEPMQGKRIQVRGTLWRAETEVYRLQVGGDTLWRLFWTSDGAEQYWTYQDSEISLIEDAAQGPRASTILEYWRSLVAHLTKEDDPLRLAYDALDFVHPESALCRYLNAEPITSSEHDEPLIFPFSCNLSQREAVEQALQHPVSVIDGPPGTGKTQTILNLVANIIDSSESTVGIVSFNNAAVDNVRDKLIKEGFGYVVAGLGRKEKRDVFFGDQSARNHEVRRLVESPVTPRPTSEELAELDQKLHRWQKTERDLAQQRAELDAYRLEQQHFTEYFERQDLPELGNLPLLRKSAERIIDYLAETEPASADGRRGRGLLRRIKSYIKYGPTRGIDPGETHVILQLQRAYYDRRISELGQQIARYEATLRQANFAAVAEKHRQLSIQALRAGLRERYASQKSVEYTQDSFRQQFAAFVRDYPVILSTCHSLRRCLASGFLLDYLIIDEASQVDLLAAGLALACARNVIVVGDERQLEHIPDEKACDHAAPAPAQAYDYRRQNILSSMKELYGDAVPRTMLREHYRCDPAIIGFCNKKFYDGQLIPFTRGDPAAQPMTVVRTVEGNHMRQHDGGGRTNQREIDVIVEEVLPQYCRDIPDAEIGITTPYRRQADKAAAAFIDSIQADTVHKFQGREKQAIVMTTVLDETWRGRTGIGFVDDPHMVNVAVSRATKKFVLVTNHDMLSKSRHLRDLIGYIQYHDPEQDIVDSTVVSVFDLLYREYSERLRPLASRLRGEMKYQSEDIIWTELHDIFAEPAYGDFHAVSQVLLHTLVTDRTGLTAEQIAYIDHRASVDFVVYNRITNQLVQVIEVDGFKYHENNPVQLGRDALKNAICETCRIPLLRLPTTGSGEERLIREALDRYLDGDSLAQ